MNKVTVLEIELIKEIKNTTFYEIMYMGEKVQCVVVKGDNGNVTYNWDREMPEQIFDLVEGWLEEEY